MDANNAIWHRRVWFTFYCLLICSPYLQGQAFKLMRFDERYQFLKDSSGCFYNTLKFIPLSSAKTTDLSIGGEARLEYVAFNNEDWGRLGTGHHNFLLQRYDLHADLHHGSRFRLFIQFRAAFQGGPKGKRRTIEQDNLNVQNAFIDVLAWKHNNRSIIMRAGRQELDYGSGRLISVREGANTRLYFTGVKTMYVAEKIKLDALVMMADSTNPGVFDNKFTKKINLWGIYCQRTLRRHGSMDIYYLGVFRNGALFEAGNQNETRHTVGSRLWKTGDGLIYNVEAAYQFGRFGDDPIHAWTGSIDIGYTFSNLLLKPSVNLRNDYISGDLKAGDGKLQTFHPLYPKAGYFGFSPQIGPVNLIDIHPYGTLSLLPDVSIQGDVIFHWRYSLKDGVYRPGGNFNLAGQGSGKRFIGTAYLLSAEFNCNKFMVINMGAHYFKIGSFIKSIIDSPKNSLLLNTRIVFKI